MANKIDYKFISDREGGRQLLGYVPNGGGSKSGVTVATGFDLGQRNEADLKKLKLSKTLIDKLKPYLGLTKKNAIDAIKKKPLMINSAQALEIDKNVKSSHVISIENKYNTAIEKDAVKFKETFARFIFSVPAALKMISKSSFTPANSGFSIIFALLEQKLFFVQRSLKDLPAEAQTVIASVSFQYGINLQRKAPLFWKAVTSQDWKETGNILDNFGDAYNSRRKLESELIKKIKNDN